MIRKIYYLYLVLFLTFSIFTYLFVDSNFFYLKSLVTGIGLHDRILVSLIYLLYMVLFFILYFLLIKNINRVPAVIKSSILPTVIVLAFLIFSYPTIISYDVFNYAATAKVTFGYRENPYIIMPIEFRQDSLLRFTQAANKIALYAPFWILISFIPFVLAFGNYLVLIYLFKLLAAIFLIGCVYLLLKLSDKPNPALYFALSPLVLVETIVSGHNDIVMMFLALAAFYFAKNKKILISLVFIFLSILIKYSTIVLLPTLIYSIYLIARNVKIDWDRIYFLNFVLLFIVFLLSPIRAEIYPWYAIWPLSFLVLTKKRNLIYLFTFFSFCLMARYIPYMLTGDNFGLTPNIKMFMTFFPTGIIALYMIFKKKLLANNSL
ncbi:MAG TPA: hypothetical protein VG917_04230 [Patescibacteria group bacterium]|nr:hypothetical protein [Patescibacteria group bacterium]